MNLSLSPSPAWANEPPVILNPTADITVTEGDAVVIPFVVHEPNNDVVKYSVDRMIGDQVQPALPAGATFITDPETAERKLVWWPDLTQAGSYDLRFRAVDEKGASAERTVTVTVSERIGTPAITKVWLGWYMPDRDRLLTPGSTYVLSESNSFLVGIILADPENENLDLEVSGMPKATLTKYDWGYALEWATRSATGSHTNVGVYPATLTVTDASGNTSSVAFTLDVRQVWDHQSEMVYVRPEARQGVIRSLGSEYATSIVRGNVTFGLESTRLWSYGPFPFPAEARYRYVLHTADANGNDVKTYLSDILTGPQEITWDSRTIPDGTYAMDTEFIDGGTTLETGINRFRPRPLFVIVDNTSGVVTGPQWLPQTGFVGAKTLWYEPTAVYWVRFSGVQEQATVHSYPYHAVPVPTTDTERQTLAATNQWFAETWLKPWNARYYSDPGFFRTQEGHLVVAGVNWYGSDEAAYSERFPETDGGRNQVSIPKHISLRPDSTDPGFLGVGIDGQLVRIDPSNTAELVKTIAGWVTRSDSVPFLPWDAAVSLDQIRQEQKQLVGSFENNIPFNYSRDLAIDPANPNLIYIADTGNHRIALVDRSGPQAVITTFAGKPGEAGYANGSRLDARFSEPMSVEIVGLTLYVIDRENRALRAIDLATGNVTTPVGKSPGVPSVPDCGTVSGNLDAYTWTSVSFENAALVCPASIRRYANGDLLLLESPHLNSGGGNLRRIRFGEQRVDQLMTPGGTPIRGVRGYPGKAIPDWRGNVGPVDEVLMAGGNGTDHGTFRITSDGIVTLLISSDNTALYSDGDTPFYIGTGGAYPVGGPVIDDESARFAYTGQYQTGLAVLRPREATDPSGIDHDLVSRGRDLYMAGTTL